MTEAPPPRRGVSLRIGLAGLVLAAMLPMLAFSAWMVVRMADAQRANAEHQGHQVALSLAVAVERELTAMIATLQVLSTAHGFVTGDMAELHRQASELLRNKEIRREGTNIVLATAQGQQLWATRLPYGTPLPDAGGSPMMRRVAETGEAAVSDLFTGSISNTPLVTVGVPVKDGATLRYVLSMGAPAHLWAGVMQRQGVPEGWTAALSDTKGRIIARAPFDPVSVGGTTSAATAAATAGQRSGSFRDDSSQTGLFTAFARSSLSGWMVTVTVPAAHIDAPLRSSLMLMAAGGGLVLLLSTGLTLLVGRRISDPVRRLAVMADALGRGTSPTPPPAVIREVSAVADALRATSRRLKDADAQRRLSMEAGRIGVWRFDPLTRRFHGWGRAAELLGIGPAGELDAPLDAWLLHVPLEHIDGLMAALMPRHATVEEFDLEFPVEPPDSPRRWLAIRGSFLAEAVPGSPTLSTRAVGVLEDVTERRRIMEERLIEASERHAADRRLFAAIVERTSDLVAAIDTSHRLILFNTAYQRNVEWAFGRSPRIGSRLESRDGGAPPDDGDGPQFRILIPGEAFGHWQRALSGERLTAMRRFTSSADPGRTRHVEVVYDAIPGSDGAPIGAFMVGRDVTERENALAALRAAEDSLRQAQKMEAIGHLTGGIAHDFNNLLQAVGAALYLVEIRQPGPEVMTPLLTAQQAVKRGATLTQHLLAFSRRQRLDPRAVDVAALVAGMQGLMERTLGGTIQIVRETEPGLWPALVDANQLEMAILNLSINARDAMPGGGTLTIAVGNAACPAPPAPGVAPGDYVRVAVRDTGTGMSEEVAARAFEPFFTTKGVGHGTGLGLSMVHGLAAQSGGAVLLDSRLGQGTTITLLLPRAPFAATAEPDDAVPPPPPPVATAAAILLVEDEVLVRLATAALLSEHGYEVEEAGTGEEALECAARRRPDAVVTDYAMPGMTGLELTRRLRGLYPGLPVVMVTGYAEIPQPLLHEERLVVLQKPYLTDDLLGRLRDGLSGKGTVTPAGPTG